MVMVMMMAMLAIDGDGDDGAGGVGGDGGGGGGWFNRVDKINTCWENGDWDGIAAVLEEAKSTLLWGQVMAKRHGKSKGKGKGGGSKGGGKSKKSLRKYG